jgi:hypothetical protein
VSADDAFSESTPPDRNARIAVAAAIAIVCAVYTWFQHGYFLSLGVAPDSLNLWRAAGLLGAGHDPWSVAVWQRAAELIGQASDPSWRVRLAEPLYYPMPAVLLWLPLSRIPFLAASTLFNAVSAFLFVMAVTRSGLARAWACGSMPFMFAMRFGQWSPLLCAGLIYPWLSGLLVTKPNIGLALFAARPQWRRALLCAAVVIVPTMLAPMWLTEWLRNVSTEMGRRTPHPVPVLMYSGAGALLLLALSKWRRSDARLLVVLACAPQLPYWADQLPLMLIANTRREQIGTMLISVLGFTAWMIYAPGRGDFVDTMRPFSLICSYLPALILVLRRSNTSS